MNSQWCLCSPCTFELSGTSAAYTSLHRCVATLGTGVHLLWLLWSSFEMALAWCGLHRAETLPVTPTFRALALRLGSRWFPEGVAPASGSTFRWQVANYCIDLPIALGSPPWPGLTGCFVVHTWYGEVLSCLVCRGSAELPMDWVDGRPLQNLTMQMLWKILFLIFLEIGHRLGLADSPPTSPVCPDEPEDPEEEEPDDDNVLDEVGADAPCVTDEPEAETLPSGEPSSSSHPSSSTPRVSGPSLPWIDVNDELEWPGGPPKYDPFDRPRSRSPRTN